MLPFSYRLGLGLGEAWVRVGFEFRFELWVLNSLGLS
jgi:hypothetical protein